MIPAHLYIATLHHAFQFELLCTNVAARLLQGCHNFSMGGFCDALRCMYFIVKKEIANSTNF